VGQRLPVVIADDEAVVARLMSGSSTDQGGGKRRCVTGYTACGPNPPPPHVGPPVPPEVGGMAWMPPCSPRSNRSSHLQQSLMARLDRLGPAREVAQVGAAIGRDFSYELLKAVAGIEDGALQLALDRLADADILLVQGLPPNSDYRFKHALIQDAAYENLAQEPPSGLAPPRR
jgi:hypothetical protein